MQYTLKESNIKWLGKIPKHWDKFRIKDIVDFFNGDGFSHNFQGKSKDKVNNIPFFKVSDINKNTMYIDSAKNYVSNENIADNSWSVIPKNCLILAKIGEALKKNHRIINKNECIIDNNLLALKHKNNDEIRYLYYFMKNLNMDLFIKSGAVPSVGMRWFKNQYIYYPPLNEQNAIAEFLDKQCNILDKVIQKREQQVKLLTQYKQSLIYEATTKGLDSSVTLKESNIKWLGKIPEHWGLRKITEITSFIVGFTPTSSSNEFYGGKHKWITINDMDKEAISNTKKTLSDLGIENRENKLTKKGSLLYSFKLTVGKTAFADEDCYTNEAIASFKPTNKINMRFFKYSIGNYLIHSANENIYGAPLLNESLIKCARVLYPPLQEQQAIAEFLDNKCSAIDKLLTNYNQHIEYLKEYKKSLIFECVTGKKQVC